MRNRRDFMKAVSVLLSAALAAGWACAGGVADPDPSPPELRANVAGGYALVAYRAAPLPGAYEGTRITRFRTIAGSLLLHVDSSYDRTVVQEYVFEDESNPVNPGPVYDTVYVTQSGAYRVYRDSVVFAWQDPDGPASTWSAQVGDGTLRTFDSGNEVLRYSRR